MASSQACGCKGIRSCALCENEGRKNRFADEASLAREIFHFCIDCGACYADGKEHKCGERSAVCLDGVKVFRDFVSPEEEERLVKAIDSDPWKPSQSGRLKQVNTFCAFFFFITTGSLVGLLLPVHFHCLHTGRLSWPLVLVVWWQWCPHMCVRLFLLQF